MGQKTIRIQLKGSSDSTRRELSIDVKSMTWHSFLKHVQSTLSIEDDIEGLYDSHGLQYWSLRSLPIDKTVFVRIKEDACIIKSLLVPVGSNQDYVGESSWASLKKLREARSHLNEVKNTKEDFIQLKYEKKDLGVEDLHVDALTTMVNAKKANGVASIFEEMRRSTGNYELQVTGCRFLAELISSHEDSEEFCYLLIAEKFPEFLLNQLNLFVSKEKISHYSLWLLGTMIRYIIEDGDETCLERRILECCLEKLNTFASSRQIVLQVLKLFLQASNVEKDSSIRVHFDELGILNAVLAIMKNFPDDALLHEDCIFFFKNILFNPGRYIPTLTDEHIESLLVYIEASRVRFYLEKVIQSSAIDLTTLAEKKYKIEPHKMKNITENGKVIGALYLN